MAKKQKKQVTNHDVRKAMYTATDGLYLLLDAIHELDDNRAEELRKMAHDAFDKLHDHMNDNYLWD